MITSIQNEKIKKWRKLHKRKGRDDTGTFLIEGFHLVEEACKSDWHVLEIILQEKCVSPAICQRLPHTYVSEQVFFHISQTQSPQGIAAVVKIKQTKSIGSSNILMVDAIQDPGNLGTMIRTADAAGFHKVILGTGTVDVFNDKVIRSTQGSIFHVSVRQGKLQEMIPKLQQNGYAVWAAALDNAKDYRHIPPQKKNALIVGNEGAGINNQILKMVDTVVKIPIYGRAESLNVSIAAGILMYYINS